MTEWALVEPATAEQPGIAHVYNEGVFHSTPRTAPGRLIRFEGMNLEALRAQRPKYDIVD